MFLTTTLEPGRCGVGDYTLQMARRVAATGIGAGLLAMRDPHVDAPVQASGSDGIPLWRLPYHGWTDATRGEARRAIEAFAPDWLCLQVSPYGLGHRGLLRRFVPWMQQLRQGYRLQIMYHELWVGGDVESPWSARLEGWLQRRLLLAAHHRLGPDLSVTSNPLMAGLLAAHGVTASVLALPSNIAVSQAVEPKDIGSPSGLFRVLLFGRVLGGWPWKDILGELARQVSQRGERLELLHIGRNSAEGARTWELLQQDAGDQWTCTTLGPLSAGAVSEWMQASDVGLAITPMEIVGKSSAAAAYRAHGLPVLCVQPPLRPRALPGFRAPAMEGFHRATPEVLADLAARRILRTAGETACPGNALVALLSSVARTGCGSVQVAAQ